MGRVLVVLSLTLAIAAPATAQQGDRSVLLVLDSSKSMNEPAGSGGETRLDAARAAVKELLEALPENARLGLRVYGARVSEATRAEGCRDTELVIPVGALDRSQVTRVVDGLEGRGRTPIGRSLLAAPEDFTTEGRRTVILVSDGGDNCAPPDPCRAAEQVARRGIEMTIQVVGLQVDERVRRQLECIADAGGGTYVDADDPDSLRAELAAAFARATRRYEPTGEPIDGGPGPEAAAAAEPGQYLDELGPGRARWYSVDLKKGQRLFAAATVISRPPPQPQLSWLLDVVLQDPRGEVLVDRTTNYRTTGGRTPVGTVAASLEAAAPADGTYRFAISVRDEALGLQDPLPVEVVIGVGGGEEPPPMPEAGSAAGAAAPREKASDVPELAGVGAAGLLLGAVAGFAATRRRRPA